MNIDPFRSVDDYMNQLSVGQKQELQRLADLSESMKPQDLLIKMIAERGFKMTMEDLSAPRLRVYPKEAESLAKERPLQRKRTSSLPPLNKLNQEISKDKAIEVKTGEIWECIDRTPNKSQGYLYHFQVKRDYDRVDHPDDLSIADEAFNTKIKLIFPAIEPSSYASEIVRLDPSKSESEVREFVFNKLKEGVKYLLANDCNRIFSDCSERSTNPEKFQNAVDEFIKLVNVNFNLFPTIDPKRITSLNDIKKLVFDLIETFFDEQMKHKGFMEALFFKKFEFNGLNKLGYRSYSNEQGKLILVLPDKDALMANWNILKEETHPDLPPLDIRSSEGIADDISFVEAYFTSDVLLSDGREFVHDHTAHLMPMLSMMLSATGKALSRAEAYKKIKWELVKGIMSAYKKIMMIEHTIGGAENLNISKEELEKFKVSLGALVDQLTNRDDLNVYNSEVAWQTTSAARYLPTYIWDPLIRNDGWSEDFWKRRFNNEELKINELIRIWDQIYAFVPNLENKKTDPSD